MLLSAIHGIMGEVYASCRQRGGQDADVLCRFGREHLRPMEGQGHCVAMSVGQPDRRQHLGEPVRVSMHLSGRLHIGTLLDQSAVLSPCGLPTGIARAAQCCLCAWE